MYQSFQFCWHVEEEVTDSNREKSILADVKLAGV